MLSFVSIHRTVHSPQTVPFPGVTHWAAQYIVRSLAGGRQFVAQLCIKHMLAGERARARFDMRDYTRNVKRFAMRIARQSERTPPHVLLTHNQHVMALFAHARGVYLLDL